MIAGHSALGRRQLLACVQKEPITLAVLDLLACSRELELLQTQDGATGAADLGAHGVSDPRHLPVKLHD